MISWRFIPPNNPIRAGVDFLNILNNEYIADIKIDGWRLLVGKFGGKLQFRTKNNKSQLVSKEIYKYLNELIPDGCELDCEYINHNRCLAINKQYNVNVPIMERVIIFDVRWSNYKFLSMVSLADRRNLNVYRSVPVFNFERLHDNLPVTSVSWFDKSIMEMYDTFRDSFLLEGLVLKKKNGNMSSNWYKVKYR